MPLSRKRVTKYLTIMSETANSNLEQLRRGKIYVAGHQGMVGSALVRRLKAENCETLLLRQRDQLNLTDQAQVREFMGTEEPDYVFLAAAKVGGIHANNTYPADYIYDNLMIATNVIQAAYESAVTKLLFLGSSCVYPRDAPQPMPESCLLSGQLESTNEPYAIAKIAGIKLCESFNRQYGTDFRSVMPTNLYGPNDSFDLKNSHVLPALIRKFHEAKENAAPSVEIWGTGEPKREFLYVDDLADAAVFIMCLSDQVYQSAVEPMMSHINIGTGADLQIRQLAELVKKVVEFNGTISFDSEKPDGTPQKLLDVSKLKALGWESQMELEEGVRVTYQWYLRDHQS